MTLPIIHKKSRIREILFIIPMLSIILGSCSNLRYLDEGERLYTGSNISLETEGRVPNKSEIKDELSGVLRPTPNEKFLFWRTRLWFYNIAGDDPKGPIGKFLKNRLGRPPVLWQDFNVHNGADLMENRLFNMGFFDADVEFETHVKDKTASADYTVFLRPAFKINEVLPIREESEIAAEINSVQDKTLLRPGRVYELSRIREERERISLHLRDQGYFYFNPDFLIFRADTTVGGREVQMALGLKNNIPPSAMDQYRIRNITINADHSLNPDEDQQTTDSVYTEEGMLLLNNRGVYKPGVLEKAVFFEKDSIYNTRDHDLSINHLMGLGVFKFVNIRFHEASENDSTWLDTDIFLTPMEKKTISTEIRGVSKSTDFAGPGINVSFANRNLLGGAEHFSINLDGSYEVLLGRNRSATSLEAGITSELAIPRFVAPFGIRNISPTFIPQTRISLGFNFLSRTDAFSLYSMRSDFGYQWSTSVTTQHRLTPFVFNIFTLGKISPDYEEFFSQEVLQRRGLFEQFLLGSEYSYLYNSQLRRTDKHSWYLNFNLDLSGNLLYLAADNLGLGKKDEDGNYSIFNQSFSQYSKTDFDIRYYLDLGHGQKIATRLIAGVGIPYGNSTTLPYVKLFTIGGSNSIRAFQPRSLGPGGYIPPDTLRGSFNIFQSGELKLEASVEYRYDFTSIIKGAVFLDAGNVWNIEERQTALRGQFKKSDFLNQIALGTGLGVRFDFTFFLLRLDLAFPLAIPNDGTDGYFQPIRPLDGSWRSNNLLLNLAIGYPF
jgi:outer membrane protein insertion porin family